MDRREFGKLVGAALTFPATLLKAQKPLTDPKEILKDLKTNKEYGLELGIPEYLWVHAIRTNDEESAPIMQVQNIMNGDLLIGGPLGSALRILYRIEIQWGSLLRIGDVVSVNMCCDGWDDWTEYYKVIYVGIEKPREM